jgi:hypothetical protein
VEYKIRTPLANAFGTAPVSWAPMLEIVGAAATKLSTA